MMSHTRRAVGALLAMFVAATFASCDGSPFGPLGPMVEGDLAERRDAWDAKAIDDYDLALTYAGSWSAPTKSVVEVRGGVVVACRDPGSGQARNHGDDWLCPSIEELFDRVEQLSASGDGWTMQLRYDQEFGMIRKLYADVPGWADEEFGYTVTGFRRR